VVGPLQVVCLAAGQEEADRVAQRVDQGVDFLPVVKGEKGGAVTPPERACLIRIRYGHRLWRRLLVGYTSDPVEPRAVLAAVKTASRRFRRWPSASLDRHCARRAAKLQAGTEKRHSSRTEKL
jgi:hypothetical protein